MLFRHIFRFIPLLLVTGSVIAQTVPVGTQLIEELIRIRQLTGEGDSTVSLTIRPVQFSSKLGIDLPGISKPTEFLQGKGRFQWFPVSVRQQFNSHHSYGWNDGSLYPAKGYQAQVSAGFHASYGILSVQFKPEFVAAQNSRFRQFSRNHNDLTWLRYYEYQNIIDNPTRFGDNNLVRLFPGQSNIRLNYKKLSLGISTENLWWGPGTRNSLLMSNTAPGFRHITFNTREPVQTFLGRFEWQVIAGLLENSGILPEDTGRRFNNEPLYQPKNNSRRYINAMALTWQPKWVNGLSVGFTRSFYQYTNTMQSGLNSYIPVFTAFFKSNASDESQYGRDQLFSLFFRWVFKKSNAEIYAEYGRNDHSLNGSDLLLQPEHSRAYTVGLKKLFERKNKKWLEFMFELTSLEKPNTQMAREIQSWYTHHQVRHGYTHYGQVLGAGIGPGSNSQTIGISWISEIPTLSLSIDRIARNNDFFYSAFSNTSNSRSNWVDLAFNGSKSWARKKFLFTLNLSLIISNNYQWSFKNEPQTLDGSKPHPVNLFSGLGVSYLL